MYSILNNTKFVLNYILPIFGYIILPPRKNYEYVNGETLTVFIMMYIVHIILYNRYYYR